MLYIVLKSKLYMSGATNVNKHRRVSEGKSKANALRHCKIDPVLKTDATLPSWLNLCG